MSDRTDNATARRRRAVLAVTE
ncbi:MAG: hypothetical protein JWQ45_1083, partial [Blastococcus sp.]|nr:hypothetical protein [Blastococcus sp.]